MIARTSVVIISAMRSSLRGTLAANEASYQTPASCQNPGPCREPGFPRSGFVFQVARMFLSVDKTRRAACDKESVVRNVSSGLPEAAGG